MIRVEDQERALGFYRDVLGFSVLHDNQVAPEMRWLHLAAPGGGLELALADWTDRPGSIRGLFLEVDDMEATSAVLAAAGVDFTRPVDDTPFGRFHPFTDPDGNELVLHEPPAAG